MQNPIGPKGDEGFEGTTLGGNIPSADSDVEALIRETIEQSKEPAREEEKKPAKEFAGTPITLQPPAKIVVETPPQKKEAAAPVQPQQQQQQQQQPSMSAYESTFKEYKVGDIVKGKVVRIDAGSALVDINYKAEGLLPASEISEKQFSSIGDVLKVGDIIDVGIEKLEDKEGYVVLSKRKADYEMRWNEAYDAYKSKKVLEAKVTSAVRGGLVVDCNGIRGFIPASQVVRKTDTPLEDFVGKQLPIKILEIDRRQGKIVVSHKLAAGESHRYQQDKALSDVEVGQVKHGKVTSIKQFGAFVDIGGVEGLVHLSELSWKRVNHPSELLEIGQEVDVFVLGVDRSSRKVALGMKELQPDPWVEAADKYKVGDVVKGKVARLTKFGAFVELEGGLEGLVHLSELSDTPVKKPEDAVQAGQEIKVKVLRVLPDEQRIGLSIREVRVSKEQKEFEEYKSQEEVAKKNVTIGDMVKQKNEEGAGPE